MPVLPGRALLLALIMPFILSLAAIAEPSVAWSVVLVDGVILGLAIIDLMLCWRPGIEITRTVPEILSLARPVTVQLDVKNLLRRRVTVRINDAVFPQSETQDLPLKLDIGRGVVRSGTYRLRAMQRGPHHLGDHWVRYPSPGGFWIRQLRLPASDHLKVYPDVQAVRHFELLARTSRDLITSRATKMRGGDTEFERLRDFLPDDEWRRIDWRATARRRKMTVREYQLERNQNLMFMLDCGRMMTAVWDDLTALDYALNATLMLSHVAIRRGDQVGLIAFDESVTRLMKPRGGTSASNQIIQATYDLFPKTVESDYEGGFRTLKQHVRKRTLVVILTHAIDEQTSSRLQRLARDLLPKHLPLVVMLKDRILVDRAHQKATSSEALCIQAAAAEMLLWRDRVHQSLIRSGVMVLDVLHHQLTGALVSRYLEVKARGLI
ncbi:MAG: DUF58 domain-containing protein [Myxococcota bacterium]